MAQFSNVVSIHPYFKPHAGRHAEFLALLPKFVEKTASEPSCLYYDFTVSDGIIHCREAYIGAEGAQTHLANVGDLLAQALELAELERLEIHGPASELNQLRPGMADLNVLWFTHECGLEKLGD